MLFGLNENSHCLISSIENLVAKIRSVKFSFLLGIYIMYHGDALTLSQTSPGFHVSEVQVF